MSYLDDHNGAIMAILTLVYVVATLLIVIQTQRTINQNQKFEQQRTRPHVFFDIAIEKRIVFAYLKNIGTTSAHNVEVKMEPELIRDYGKEKWPISFVENPVYFLAPGREIRDDIEVSHEFLGLHQNTSYQISVSYADQKGRRYNESSSVNFSYLNRGMVIGERDIDEISKHIKGIHQELQKIGGLINKRRDGQ